MQRVNYNYRHVFRTVFFCALFSASGLFFATSPARASHFSITLSSTSTVIDQEESASFVATATCNPGPCENTSFSFNNLPPSSTATSSTSNCVPTCSTIVTIYSSSTTPYGFYTFNVLGTDASDSASASFNLTIGYNIKGWAWSDGIGWISFNSENCDIDWDRVMDRVNVGSGAGDAAADAQCPPDGTTIPQYGAHLDLTSPYEFSGSAWSENIGWITFNKSGIGGAGTPPAAPFNDNSQGYIARYNIASSTIEGWARATSCLDTACDADSEWGWIKMSNATPNYGVSYANGEFKGFAWGDSVMSWISFNSKNCDNNGLLAVACGGDGTQAFAAHNVATHPDEYRVWINGALPNNAPTTSSLSASFSDRCNAWFSPTFTFTYNDVEGEPLAQYTINVYEQGMVPPVDTILVPAQFDGVGNVISRANPGDAVPYAYVGSGILLYNKIYHFTVTVQDEAHLGVDPTTLTPSPNSPNFNTDPHQRPRFVNSPKISWSPAAPFASSTVTFSASSTVYVVGQAGFYANTPATLSNSTYLWTITNAAPITSTFLNPSVFYASATSSIVTVTVTDQSGNVCYDSNSSATTIPCACTTQSSVSTSKSRPVFREVKP